MWSDRRELTRTLKELRQTPRPPRRLPVGLELVRLRASAVVMLGEPDSRAAIRARIWLARTGISPNSSELVA